MRMTGMLAIGLVILASEKCLADEPSLPPNSPAPVLAAPPASPADCHDCKHGESCFHHFLAWAFYHPPAAKSCCHCLPKVVPCCTPPLYTWFPCQGFGDCGPGGCTSCGEAAGPCKSECFRFFHHGKE